MRTIRSLLPFAAVVASLPLLAGSPARSADADQALIKKGEYLATVGDCVACHTPAGGKPFQGGMAMETPFGTIFPPNLTPDKDTGIGNWTDDQFYAAMHEGLGQPGNKYLYPVFPFPWYTKVTRDDALAIKAYLFSLEPVHSPAKPVKFSFPMNIRESLLAWRIAFFKPNTFQPDPNKSEDVNRGAYIVEGLGHCGECHNKSKLTGVTDLSGRLEGGEIQGWYAPNITSEGREGVGSWSDDEIVNFLRNGIAPGGGVVFGPMKQVVTESTSKMTDADLHAIAAYLKSFPADKTYKPTDANQAAVVASRGADDYLSHCASCHGVDGKGLGDKIPALAGDGAVLAKGPENVVRVAVGGLMAQSGRAPMPAAAYDLNDQQVADIVNYVRTAWGNTAPANADPSMVAKLRKESRSVLAATNKTECYPAEEEIYISKAVDQDAVRNALKDVRTPDMLQAIDDLLPKVKAATQGENEDKVVNALIQAYCPIALSDESLSVPRRQTMLGNFATLVYGEFQRPEEATGKN